MIYVFENATYKSGKWGMPQPFSGRFSNKDRQTKNEDSRYLLRSM